MRLFYRNLFITLCCVTFVMFFCVVSNPKWSKTQHFRIISLMMNSKNVSMPDIKPGNKWIVVTSVNYPTEDIKRLASFDDWNLVVVADTKTPTDWKLEDVHFLSVNYQNSLDFQIVHHLPYKSYTRKNIGYLYAISNGAEWIYDTDDDNKPYGLGLKQFNYEQEISGIRYTTSTIKNQSIIEKLFNPYRFFGLDKMWPRGFPLEYIKDHSNGEDRQVLCSKMARSSVQQGLVHHDPDVDAIYRLLNADQKGLDERFNKFAPPILLEPGTYAPWNSQNTLFHKSAFHILMLPTTVSFRTTDIWRSFFAQKILHLSGLTISFTPVNAVQFRNSHDFLKDFQDERQVYEDSGKVIRFLDEWECEDEDIPNCIQRLAEDFVEQGFWKEEDRNLIGAYIEDLIKIDYTFPSVNNNTSLYRASTDETEFNANCRRAQFEFDLTYPDSSTEPAILRAQQKLSNFEDLANWCDEANYRDYENQYPSAKYLSKIHANNYVLQNNLDNVLLIINNYPWKWGIGHLQKLYQPYFATVVFCGSYYPDEYQNTNKGFSETIKPFNFIHINPAEMHEGFFGYHCLTLLHEVGLQNVQGYIFMSDDVQFNIWQRMDYKRVFHLIGIDVLDSNGWWNHEVFGLSAAKRVLAEIANTTDVKKLEAWEKFENGLKTYGYIQPDQTAAADLLNGKSRSASDFYYVPQSEIDYYSVLMRMFFENKLFLELAVNRFLRSVRHQTSKAMGSSYAWSAADRANWTEIYNVDLVAFHPIKLSRFNSPNSERFRYCNAIIKTWHEILFKNSHNYTIKGDDEPDFMNG